jgi:hypothetical protein
MIHGNVYDLPKITSLVPHQPYPGKERIEVSRLTRKWYSITNLALASALIIDQRTTKRSQRVYWPQNVQYLLQSTLLMLAWSPNTYHLLSNWVYLYLRGAGTKINGGHIQRSAFGGPSRRDHERTQKDHREKQNDHNGISIPTATYQFRKIINESVPVDPLKDLSYSIHTVVRIRCLLNR